MERNAWGHWCFTASSSLHWLKFWVFAYRIGFPINKAVPIDDPAYSGDDELSMLDNNSSCFNGRVIAGTDRISMHALGLAVVLNPELNPYLFRDGIWYPNESHIERSIIDPGMFSEEHPVVQAFVERGFE
jgi:peptidoglycan L-alanyl-D-glutamate endopeptidase CwlK